MPIHFVPSNRKSNESCTHKRSRRKEKILRTSWRVLRKRFCGCVQVFPSRFTFGRKAPVYMPTGRRPVYFQAQSVRLHIHREAPVYSVHGPPAEARFTFGRKVPVHMPTDRMPIYCRARSAPVHAHRPQLYFRARSQPQVRPVARGSVHRPPQELAAKRV